MIIKYPSKDVRKCITSRPLLNTVKSIALGNLELSFSQFTQHETFNENLISWIKSKVDEEASHLASPKLPSLFSSVDHQSLLTLSDQKIVDELKAKTPILHTILRGAVVPQRREAKICKGQSKDISAPAISMAASILLKKRSTSLSAQAYRVGFILHHSGEKKLVIYIFTNYTIL